MENMELTTPSFWNGRRVLITGHTGFIGSWLALTLHHFGAKVSGLALPPATVPSHCDVADILSCLEHRIADLRDEAAVAEAVATAKPDVVFHLAAQALVRAAHADPLTTFATNVMGTVHLLEAARRCDSLRAIVAFTTDKVYRNVEWCWPYRESDALGSIEPYGASKAAGEHVLEAYRHSYFANPTRPVSLAVVRAGNVIGGGDWAPDRLVPDAMRAFAAGATLHIRNPQAIRPWQHVLEPVGATLRLARLLTEDPARAEGAWNVGPDAADMWPVQRVADQLCQLWPGAPAWQGDGGHGPYEASHLTLDSSRIRSALDWRPVWTLARALEETVGWYHAHHAGQNMAKVSRAQIESYFHGR